MKLNIGGFDRTFRVLLGGGLVAAAALGVLPVWGWVGLLPLVTGLVAFCPLYSLAGFNTRD